MNMVSSVIYAAMMGMVLFALLQIYHRPRQRQSMYLTALLVLLLTHILGELFITSGAYQFAPSLAGMQFPLRILLGPALYFYALATMSPSRELPRSQYLLALSGPVLVIIAILPFILGFSAEEKLALADPKTRNPEHFKVALFACLSALTLFMIFTASYLVATLRLHTRHRENLLNRFSSIERRSLDWFRVILWLWGAAWLLYGMKYVPAWFGWQWNAGKIILPLFEAAILMFFAHLALRQPVLKDEEKAQPITPDPRKTLLTSQQMQTIANKLERVMQEEKLFLEEDLSLNRLSQAIGVSENYISETLSQQLCCNFFNFVNRYRIELAQHLLKESNKQVTTIAYESGFNTKSTFNSAFKKFTGDTPSAYRKQFS